MLRDLDKLRSVLLMPRAAERYSPLGPENAIVISKALLDAMDDAADGTRLCQALRRLPCPIIGVADEFDRTSGHAVCDLFASPGRDLGRILANIDRSPIAATVLIQTLRATSEMPMLDALAIESMAFATLQFGTEHRGWLSRRNADQPVPDKASDPAVTLSRMGDQLEIKLNRPDSLNAINVEMRDALYEALQLLETDASIGGATVSGVGRCFSIGGDLAEFGIAADPGSAHAIRSIRLPALILGRCGDRINFKLHGACIGAGIEIPAFGRRVVAARSTFFQLPEITFGLIPGAGGCVSIPRRIGRQKTAYFALSALRISAKTALEWGLVDALSD